MTTPSEDMEMVAFRRAEFDALKAELRRLHVEEGRRVALERIKAFRPDQPGAPIFRSREELAEALGASINANGRYCSAIGQPEEPPTVYTQVPIESGLCSERLRIQ